MVHELSERIGGRIKDADTQLRRIVKCGAVDARVMKVSWSCQAEPLKRGRMRARRDGCDSMPLVVSEMLAQA